MPAQSHVATQPAQTTRAPSGSVLWFRLAVTGAAASLVSYLPGGVLPTILVPNMTGPALNKFAFKGVKLQSEIDPGVTIVRYTDDGQAVPSAILGGVVPGQPNQITLMCDPQDVQLFATAGTVNVQCCLIIGGTTTGTN